MIMRKEKESREKEKRQLDEGTTLVLSMPRDIPWVDMQSPIIVTPDMSMQAEEEVERQLALATAKKAEAEDVKKEIKEKKEARRTILKQGLRDAIGLCKTAAAQQDFFRPPHLVGMQGIDLLSRHSLPLFGPPVNKVSRVEGEVESPEDRKEKIEEEGEEGELDRAEAEEPGAEEMEWAPMRVQPA